VIGQDQRVEKRAGHCLAAVANKIDLEHADGRVLHITSRTHGNRLLERCRGGRAPQASAGSISTYRSQQAVDGGWTHLQHLRPRGVVEGQAPVTFEKRHEQWKQRNETFAGDAVRGFPEDDQGRDVRVDQRDGTLAAEKPYGVLAVVSSDPGELVEDARSVFAPTSIVPRSERREELLPFIATGRR
jgi:hypothetical protein